MVSRSTSSSSGIWSGTYSRNHESGTSTLELPRHSQVAAPELADVGNAVPQLGDPLQAPSEGEPRDLLRVVADELEHVRVDHPRASDLDPAFVVANAAALLVANEAGDVGFDGRLREREEARANARLPVLAEQPPEG